MPNHNKQDSEPSLDSNYRIPRKVFKSDSKVLVDGKEKKASKYAKLVAVIDAFAPYVDERTGGCFLSIEQIAYRAGLDRPTASRLMDEARKAGIVLCHGFGLLPNGKRRKLRTHSVSQDWTEGKHYRAPVWAVKFLRSTDLNAYLFVTNHERLHDEGYAPLEIGVSEALAKTGLYRQSFLAALGRLGELGLIDYDDPEHGLFCAIATKKTLTSHQTGKVLPEPKGLSDEQAAMIAKYAAKRAKGIESDLHTEAGGNGHGARVKCTRAESDLHTRSITFESNL